MAQTQVQQRQELEQRRPGGKRCMIATWLTPDDLARARELAGKYRTHSQTIFTAVIQAALDDEKLLKRLLGS